MARASILFKRLFKKLREPFKGSSGRVSRSRTRREARSSAVKLEASSAKPSVPKSTKTMADRAKVSRGQSLKQGKFWSNLFWVRPWLLVVALWLTFVLMIAIALAGLSNPGREMALEPVESSIVGQPLSAPDVEAVSRLIPKDQIVLTQRDPAATLPNAAEKSMPAWPLLVMVAACAGGCMLMSNQDFLHPESRRGRRQAVDSQAAPRPIKAVRSPVSHRKRRAKHRRSARRSATHALAFRFPVQQQQKTSLQRDQVVAKSVSAAVDVAAATSHVTVVPASETSPLDWKEGSLAHKLDVRQTRSINSFL